MTGIRPSILRCAVGVAAIVTLATGCGGSGPDSGAGATATQGATNTDNPASENASTPALEGTGAESPQQPSNAGPTISVASLPVGGDKNQDGARQCAHVNLITSRQLPKWVSVSIDSIGLQPEGIFQLGGDLCEPAGPACAGYSWTAGTTGRECAVNVTQIKDSIETVRLVLAGTVHCRDQGSCEEVQSALRDSGARIEFTASAGVVSDALPSVTGTPTAGS